MGVRTMATRDFIHGGYRERTGPVVVLSGGEVAGVWFPGTTAIAVSNASVTYNPSVSVVRADMTAAPVRAVPKPKRARRA